MKDTKSIHRAYAWAISNPEALSDGELEHLPRDLYNAGLRHELIEVLKSFPFMMSRIRAGKLETTLSNYRELAADVPELAAELSFFSTNMHLLRRGSAKWPAHKILLQRAYEHGDDSAITQAAERWLEQGGCDWYWLRNQHRPEQWRQAQSFSRQYEQLSEDSDDRIDTLRWTEDRVIFWNKGKGLSINLKNVAHHILWQRDDRYSDDAIGMACRISDTLVAIVQVDKLLLIINESGEVEFEKQFSRSTEAGAVALCQTGNYLIAGNEVESVSLNLFTGQSVTSVSAIVPGQVLFPMSHDVCLALGRDRYFYTFNCQTLASNRLRKIHPYKGRDIFASLDETKVVGRYMGDVFVYDVQRNEFLFRLPFSYQDEVIGVAQNTATEIVMLTQYGVLQVCRTAPYTITFVSLENPCIAMVQTADGQFYGTTGRHFCVFDNNFNLIKKTQLPTDLKDSQLYFYSNGTQCIGKTDIYGAIQQYDTAVLVGDHELGNGGSCEYRWIESGLFACKTWQGDLRIVNRQWNEVVSTLTGSGQTYDSFANLGNSYLALATDTGNVEIWNRQSSKMIGKYRAHNNTINGIKLLANDLLATWSDDGTVHIFNFIDCESVCIIENRGLPIKQILVLPDNRIAGWGPDQLRDWDKSKITIWNRNTGIELFSYRSLQPAFHAHCFQEQYLMVYHGLGIDAVSLRDRKLVGSWNKSDDPPSEDPFIQYQALLEDDEQKIKVHQFTGGFSVLSDGEIVALYQCQHFEDQHYDITPEEPFMVNGLQNGRMVFFDLMRGCDHVLKDVIEGAK